MTLNSFHRLKKQAEAESTRIYKARGIQVKRCSNCQIAPEWCICALAPNKDCELDFILLFHNDEIFKPTNSGRLIADAFPRNSFAFRWSRKSPEPALIELLEDNNRQCYILFPADQNDERPMVSRPPMAPRKRLTLILLDATWRQGRRMFNSSQWMKHIPVLKIDPQVQATYATRKAHQSDYLSTAESAALALSESSFKDSAKVLLDYFSEFNRRYLKMRSNHKPKGTNSA